MDENDRLDLALNDDHDLDIEGWIAGEHDGFVRGVAGVAQAVHIAIKLFKGELFTDAEAGIPYFQEILGHRYDEVRVGAAYRGVIALVSGVRAIREFSLALDRSTRTLSVTWRVTTVFGDTETETTDVEF